MKKILALVLTVVMAASLAACGNSGTKETQAPASGDSETAAESTAAESTGETAEKVGEGVDVKDLKVGFIFIGDENEGYTAAHYAGAKGMQEALGLSDDQIIIKWNIPEDETCYDAAVDLADQGCNIVFANSFGHESYILQAAAEFPDVQFCHATGYQAAGSGLANMHNYFTSIYESRYVSGVVAGMKLNEMIADGKITEDTAQVGYVGAYPYAEVISGFTSFFLGVRSQCPSATMEVKYTNSWASFDLEKECAESLIADKCVLISQHADTTGAPTACQAAGVPCVGYNISMIETAPDAALTSASINKGFAEGADKLTDLNDKVVAEGTAEKVKEVEDAIIDGSLHVFDTSTFTVNGKELTDADSEYISDGYFHESEKASAPAFDFIIDGITAVTQ